MTRPLLLDLYCGAGGAAVGYHRSGFDIVGVDIVRQPEYPYAFVRADALNYLRHVDLNQFAVIHASPPCKAHTQAKRFNARLVRLFDPNADYLTPTLELLAQQATPWVVENVEGAPMPDNSVTLCGSAFGLQVRRHRLFASNLRLHGIACDHATQGPVVSVVGHTSPGRGRGVPLDSPDQRRAAMGIDWIRDRDRLAQAIPPAYTEYIGRQLHAALFGWVQLDLFAE
jgi:DNA (cytosine-5)-methyltransferase 1